MCLMIRNQKETKNEWKCIETYWALAVQNNMIKEDKNGTIYSSIGNFMKKGDFKYGVCLQIKFDRVYRPTVYSD